MSLKKIKFLTNEFVGITKSARAGVYDLICEDERGHIFIVEMQLGFYPNFIQRAKFYAFHRFNTLVEKGKYTFDNLTPIICIGFLAKGVFPHSEQYYHYGTLKNQIGEELDTQITHVIVEIDKFEKEKSEIETDLDKLIYIMKHSEILQTMEQLPPILSEDWIMEAKKRFDKSRMTPDQRMHFEMMLARNASILVMERLEKEEREKKLAQVKAEEAEKLAQVKAENLKLMEQKAIETARLLKQNGVALEVISQSTGLDLEVIKAL